MSTVILDVDNETSAKLFLDLAKKLHFKARVITDQQKEEWALLAMMESRDQETALPVESALDILCKIKSK